MKAEELRIGNLVGIENTAIHANGCNHLEARFEIEEIRNESVHFKGFAYGEFLKDLKPIPLTEEWLIRFGFEKIDNPNNTPTWVWLKNGERWFIETCKNKDIFLKGLGFGGNQVNTNYVHQVQNLYFAITGEELTIK